ncbi:MAG TPA: hypothetical protein VF485_15240 [Sphingomonas sp.]
MSIQRSLPRNGGKGKPTGNVPVRDTPYDMRRGDFGRPDRAMATRNDIVTSGARQKR